MKGKQQHATLEREIAAGEREVVKAKEKVARLRRRLPPLEIEDYDLLGPGGEKVALSAVLGDKEDLILIHNMGKGCPYCTMWADGFNGVLKHLENRAAFVVVSPDPPAEQAKFAASRGWNFRMLSAQGTTVTRDLGFENRDGATFPGCRSFTERRTAGSCGWRRPGSAPATTSARRGTFSTCSRRDALAGSRSSSTDT